MRRHMLGVQLGLHMPNVLIQAVHSCEGHLW